MYTTITYLKSTCMSLRSSKGETVKNIVGNKVTFAIDKKKLGQLGNVRNL